MHRVEGHNSPVLSSPSCSFCSMGCYAAEGPIPSHTMWGTDTGGPSAEAQPLFLSCQDQMMTSVLLGTSNNPCILGSAPLGTNFLAV